MKCKTGTGHDWPGATIFFKAGEKDLAGYGPLRVTGFLTVTDQPYSELVEAARKIGTSMYRKRYGK